MLFRSAKGYTVRDDDLEFIANFYKYAFVGIVLNWIKTDLKENPKDIVNKVSDLTSGTIEHALNNCKH